MQVIRATLLLLVILLCWLCKYQCRTSAAEQKANMAMKTSSLGGVVQKMDHQSDRCTGSDRNASHTSACGLGYYCNNSSCQCRNAPRGIVKCGEGSFATLDYYCATSGKEDSAVEVGMCAFDCATFTSNASAYYGTYFQVCENLCKPLNRAGALCGRCLSDHYPLAYSFNMSCIPCPHARWNWVRYIMAAYLPITFFYLVILFFKINVVSSHLHPVVIFCQGLSITSIARGVLFDLFYRPNILMGMKVMLSLYGIWNLDFFRPFYSDFCLGIGILPTLALDYAIAVYPLILMTLSYLLIVLYDRNYRVVTIVFRPFRVLFSLFRRNWDIRTSVIDAFSAFFLLTNVKFLSVSFDLLVPTRVYHLYGDTYNYTLGLYYAADIEYFGSEHLPYAILAIVLLCVFVILPFAVLALYPFAFFQKFLNLFPVRWYILHTFVDSFQGCYKDGTEPGTRDCRWFSTLILSLRVLGLILWGATLNLLFHPLCSFFTMLIILLLVVVQPYKRRVALLHKTNTAFILLYALINVLLSAGKLANYGLHEYFNFLLLVAVLLALVPVFFIAVCILYWMFLRWRVCFNLVGRLRWWRRGYVEVGGSDGYDNAADAYCDRMVNPQAYPAVAGPLENF